MSEELVIQEEAPVERVRKRDLAASFAKEAAVVLAHSGARVVSRTVGWGSTGLAIGLLMCGSWWMAGVLPALWWASPLWCVLTVLAAVGGLGYVGWIRGLGRAGLYVGVERGMVPYLVGSLLDRFAKLLRKSTRVTGALDKTETMAANIPLQQWEDWLTTGVEDYLGSDDPELGNQGNLVTRFIRRFLVSRIQRYLLAIVRKEYAADGSGGGVSIARVREVGLVQCSELLSDYVEGMMFTHLAVGLGATLAVFGLPFLLAAYAPWW